jgi:hypothetical protein
MQLSIPKKLRLCLVHPLLPKLLERLCFLLAGKLASIKGVGMAYSFRISEEGMVWHIFLGQTNILDQVSLQIGVVLDNSSTFVSSVLRVLRAEYLCELLHEILVLKATILERRDSPRRGAPV